MPANPEILSALNDHVFNKTGKRVLDLPETGGDKDKPKPPERIPLPDYKDPASRLAYAHAFRDKYGKESLSGYGDIPLRVNEKPQWASDTSKNLAVKYGNAVGLNPALFYASSMIEGQSGLFPGAAKDIPANQVKFTGDKDYPVSGLWNFGLDSFQDYLPKLKEKGYLPQDFDKNFRVWDKPGNPGDPKGRGESVMFKNTDAGVQAKAAMMRAFYDEMDDYAKKKNVNLTPEQRDFFTLAHFNSGAHGFEMMDAYNKAGLLKDNSFIDKMPNVPIQAFTDFYKGDTKKSEALHKKIYGNVSPRLAAARGLIGEGQFDETPAPVTTK